MSLLTCENLSLGWEGRAVLDGLNFSVNAGDYLYIIGENGSGKSTLMKTILGLTPPFSGRVAAGDGLKRNEIGYLPQQTEAQKDFPASVREIVMSGCLNRMGLRPFYGRRERERAARSMERLGIASLARRCYRELSGGQQQRVLLARALCAVGKLLMLDEPVTGLDPRAAAEMYDLAEELHRGGLTIIMISHDLAAVARYASHVLLLENGNYFFGTRDEYLASPAGKAFTETEGGARE